MIQVYCFEVLVCVLHWQDVVHLVFPWDTVGWLFCAFFNLFLFWVFTVLINDLSLTLFCSYYLCFNDCWGTRFMDEEHNRAVEQGKACTPFDAHIFLIVLFCHRLPALPSCSSPSFDCCFIVSCSLNDYGLFTELVLWDQGVMLCFESWTSARVSYTPNLLEMLNPLSTRNVYA